MRINKIIPNTIVDTRREKTIETTLISGNYESKASVPCGKSKGDFEAFCHTIEKSIDLVNEIAPKLTSRDFSDQTDFDNFILTLDGTENKSKLGVNVTLSLSIAFCRLFSKVNSQEIFETIASLSNTQTKTFPKLFFNTINGGLHVEKSYCALPFQEYMLIPKSTSPKESLGIVLDFIEKLKLDLLNQGLDISYGDEGGYIIKGNDPEMGFQHFQKIINDNIEFQEKFYFGLDVASSSLWEKDLGHYRWENDLIKCSWTSNQLSMIYQNLSEKYPLLSIEDPFDQESWSEWAKSNKAIGQKIWIVGDDLTVTNTKRIKKANDMKAINTLLVKPNQIGTVTETLAAVKLAKSYGWKIIVSHRSGETNDDFIADLAFGVGADGLKAGSPLQVERLAKYNRLLAIESITNFRNN